MVVSTLKPVVLNTAIVLYKGTSQGTTGEA